MSHVVMLYGCVMWSCHVVMFRKQEKVRERRKSLISRNRGFRAEFRKSVRYSVKIQWVSAVCGVSVCYVQQA